MTERLGETDPSFTDRNFLSWINSGARQGRVVEQLHGQAVEDPYRLLETDSPTTRAWLEGQTARTEQRLRPFLSPAARERIERLMSIGVLAEATLGGERVFFLRRQGEQEQAVLMVRPSQDQTAEARVLFDPATQGERVAIDWSYPSPDGRWVALGLSRNGDERSTLHLLDTETGALRPEEAIEHCKWSLLSWLPDNSGFYYTRYPREGEPHFDPNHPDAYFPRVFFHQLGEPPERDRLVYGAEEPNDFPSPSVSDDGRYLVLNVMRGWSRSDVLLLDRQAPASEPVPVSVGCDCLISGAVRHGRLYLLSNEDHPRYRLLAVAPEQAGDRSQWLEIVAESDANLEGFGATATGLVLHETRRFSSALRVVGPDGSPRGDLQLPTNGSLAALAVRPGSETVAAVFSSFFVAPTLLVGESSSLVLRQVEQVATDLEVSPYRITQVSVPSADGTGVNVFIVHRADAPRDGTNHVLLYGYGGFNISLLPSFSRQALYWLEQGGVYAVANLRGGGELGEAWHRAGQLENKVHVFEDFEAVIRWLSASGWSQPDRIAIMGGSNGGLLVGATVARCPDAFGAAIGYVGLYDMLRYHHFPPAELWVSEYGSADDEHQFGYLRAYSPYHNLRTGTPYPAALIETADHDSRVFWGHSAKFAARLQDSTRQPERVFFYVDRSVGHGAGKGRSDLVEQTERLYAFLAWRWARGEEAPSNERGDTP